MVSASKSNFVTLKTEFLLLLLAALSLFVFTGCLSNYGPNSPDYYPRKNPPFNYGHPLSSVQSEQFKGEFEKSNLPHTVNDLSGFELSPELASSVVENSVEAL
jgi:hypothetical protein